MQQGYNTDCHTNDIGHWFAMTRRPEPGRSAVFPCKARVQGRRVDEQEPIPAPASPPRSGEAEVEGRPRSVILSKAKDLPSFREVFPIRILRHFVPQNDRTWGTRLLRFPAACITGIASQAHMNYMSWKKRCQHPFRRPPGLSPSSADTDPAARPRSPCA